MYIYIIYNKENDKVYIGQTIQRSNNRKSCHLYKLRRNIHENKHLQSSWNKHGEEAYEFHRLEECETVKELNQSEKLWIDVYDSLNDDYGYNIESGGKNGKMPAGTGELISKRNSKPVMKLDKNNNKVLKIYKSLTEASKDVGTGISNICACLRKQTNQHGGVSQTAGGYKWKYYKK